MKDNEIGEIKKGKNGAVKSLAVVEG